MNINDLNKYDNYLVGSHLFKKYLDAPDFF